MPPLPQELRIEVKNRLETARKAYEAGNVREAEKILIDIVSQIPDCTPALYNLGKLAEEQGEHRRAIGYCEKILAYEPRNGDVTRRMAELYARGGEMKTALQFFKKARELTPEDETIWTDFLFHLNYLNLPEAAVFMEHVRFGDSLPSGPRIPPRNRVGGKIRIGYVSPDFRKHAASYWIRPLLKNHDKSQFEVYGYCNFQAHDEVTEEFKGYTDTWRELAELTDEEAANLIRNDGIDILVDLAGHTGNNRLRMFSLRAAPIQISWFGYLNTTGVKNIDYRLTDTRMIASGRAQFYTEKLLYLPRAFAFESHLIKPDPIQLPALGRGYITFGSFNSCEKINTEVLKLWAQLLHALPTSRLSMIVEPSLEFRESLFKKFETESISRDRIAIEFTKSAPEFLKAAQEVDIALDPFPYSGGVTVFHLASLGVPSLTLEGRTEFSRTGSSIMRHAGLHDLVAQSESEFIEKGLKIVGNLPRLEEIRKTLPEKIGKDGTEVTKSVEEIYTRLVRENPDSSTGRSHFQ